MGSANLARLELALSHISQLPVMVTQALRALSAPDPDFDEVVRAISSDPTLVARILSIANSPYMGRTARAVHPRAACVSLGLTALRSAVLTVGLSRHLKGDSEGSLVASEMWAHAYATASAARCLADLTGAHPDMAYTAGLLHDIGKIVLIRQMWPDYQQVLALQAADDCFIATAERKVLGFDNVDAGVRIAQRWKLPDYIVDAIEHRGRPEYALHPEIVDVVHIANVIARALALGNPGDDLVPGIHPLVARRRNLSAEVLGERFARIESGFEQILDFME